MEDSFSSYSRVLLKCSGEALGCQDRQAINPQAIDRVVTQIAKAVTEGVEIGIVIGGGNFFRGKRSDELGLERITGDYLGMLATVMNALVLKENLERHGVETLIMSAFEVGGWVKRFNRSHAIKSLGEKKVVIFSGGTGNPLVSTDLAASLRGIEINAQVLLKATSVPGIFSADPKKDPQAVFYRHLTYKEVLEKELEVMDLAAFCQCRDYKLPIRVFDVHQPDALLAILKGQSLGTLVNAEGGA